jgi:glyoxylase-like metal-dependent hydrolase (beta-lactamase superfamily II)
MQTIQKLSNHLYYLPPYQKTDRPILGAIVGDEQTLFIDAGNSASHAKLFKDQLATHNVYGDLVLLTHWHWDHIFGLSEMNIPSISNELTNNKLKEIQSYSWEDDALDARVKAGIEIPFCADAIKLELKGNRDVTIPDPTIIFEKQLKLNLGGVTCLVEQIKADHSPDCNLLYIPEEKVLFLGDSLYANMYADPWHYTVENMTKLLDRIKNYNAETYFLSHHPAPLTKSQFASFDSLLRDSAALTEKYEGNLEQIKRELAASYERPLTEEDIEIMTYFIQGLEQA